MDKQKDYEQQEKEISMRLNDDVVNDLPPGTKYLEIAGELRKGFHIKKIYGICKAGDFQR